MIAERQPTIAIVGGGISGLACAQTLRERGYAATVFDRGRRVGGRMSSKRMGGVVFDHGCQFFTATDPEFRQQVTEWQKDGHVETWTPRFYNFINHRLVAAETSGPCFTGVAGMQSVCQAMTRGLDVRTGVFVDAVTRRDQGWRLTDSVGRVIDDFDIVVGAAPPPQSMDLLDAAPALVRQMRRVRMQPCWSAMLSLISPTGIDADAITFKDDPMLSWAACKSSQRADGVDADAWVLQSTSEWAAQNLNQPDPAVAAALMTAFQQRLGLSLRTCGIPTAHRWRYALPISQPELNLLFDAQLKLGTCGDWCGRGRVEDAWRSGRNIVAPIIHSMNGPGTNEASRTPATLV